jgi:RNA polymerase sigma factor (sigma-70 family)
MAHAQIRAALQHVRAVVAAKNAACQSDGALLGAFLKANDQAAFSALVKRHGPLVLAVCRRVLHNLQDAEDGFQATFLLLVRKAAALRKMPSLAGWLHGVAYRMALQARRADHRRRKHEGRARPMHGANPERELMWQEVQAVLDEEIQRLPAVYREAFVLCCLERKCTRDAARLLGTKESTIGSRLSRARALLQKALSRRGVSLPVLLSGMALTTDTARGAVCGRLTAETVRMASLLACGRELAVIASGIVTALVEGASRTMVLTKAKMLFLAAAMAVALGAGAASVSLTAGDQQPERAAVAGPEQVTPAAADALACLAPTAQADEVSDKTNAVKMDKLFETQSKPGSPGCALGIIRDGKLIVARGYGLANLDDDVPITTKSVFEVASMTKSFTCVCLALLMDQGKLTPEDDIRKYVPEMPRYDPPLTIRHLIRCEDALRDYWHLLQLAGWNIDDAWTDGDVLALVTRQKAPIFKPGSKFAYNNSGYLLLVRAMERITGQSLPRFADKNVFQPLGMTSTYFEDNPGRITKHRAVGYDVMPDGSIRRWMMNSKVAGTSGLKTTVEDLFKWDQNFYANRLPDGPYVRAFFKTGTLLDNRKVLDVNPTERYRGLKRMGFTGGMPGFVDAFIRFPEQKFSVICLSNDYFRVEPWTVALRIADLYLADQIKETKEPASTAPKHKFVQLPHSDLADKAGAYRVRATRIIWNVSVIDGKLALTDRMGVTRRWQALSPMRFRALEGPHKDTHTLVFEERPDKRFTMRLEADDGPKTEFVPVQLVTPDTKKLSEYAGQYYNAELDATYTFSVRDGHLFLQVNNHRRERLAPMTADEFIPYLRTPDDGRIITFVRDGEKRVIGFTIQLWRIKGMHFEKRR